MAGMRWRRRRRRDFQYTLLVLAGLALVALLWFFAIPRLSDY
jgi:hypothetical protein